MFEHGRPELYETVSGKVETARARAPSVALADRRDFPSQRRDAAARLRVDMGGVRIVWRSQTRRMRKPGLPTQR